MKHECCMSYEGKKHTGVVQCERRKTTLIKFDNGNKDCSCWTCKEHSSRIRDLILCGGCASEF